METMTGLIAAGWLKNNIGWDDRCLQDHSLQRDKGNLEIQVHEERTCERG